MRKNLRLYKEKPKKLMSKRKEAALKLWCRMAKLKFKPRTPNKPSVKINVGMEYKDESEC